MQLTLETDRLILRPFRMSDAEPMFYGWASDPVATKYLTWPCHKSVDTTREVLTNWIDEYEKPERLNFAIQLKTGGQLIGGIDVVEYIEGIPVLGYVSSRPYWGNGYMTEACKCLLKYLFDRGHKEVKRDAMVDNIGSNHVILKCGGVLQKTEWEERPLKNDTVLVNRYIVFADENGTKKIQSNME